MNQGLDWDWTSTEKSTMLAGLAEVVNFLVPYMDVSMHSMVN